MGHHQEGGAARPGLLEQEVDRVGGRLGVEVAGGLVTKDQRGVGDQGSGDRHPLPLSLAQLRWEPAQQVRDADGGGELGGPRPP